jgi:uncharacterized protein
MALPVALDRERVADFCRSHGIRRLSLFGSVLRDDFGPDSDVDVLVEFLPGAPLSLFRLVAMEEELSAIVGWKVDLRTPEELSPYFRDKVLATAEVQYAA